MATALDQARRDSYMDGDSAGNSPAGGDNGKNKDGSAAPKDRHCPFCHNAFTSSSLGRHLDLYIKEKNPKAPDGIHDVDEIRRMRSKITRRHARMSAAQKVQKIDPSQKANSSSSPASPAATSAANGSLHDPTDPPPPSTEVSSDGRAYFHRINWHATGVMSHLPPRPTGGTSSPKPPPSANHTNVTQVHLEAVRRHWEEKNTEKAAELALREVLRSVQSAYTRASRKPLFDFNFFSLNFPALCLQLLPSPSTIFSTTPSPSPDSWPLLPPGHQAFEASNAALTARLATYVQTDIDLSPYREHLTRTFNHWQSLSSQHQQEAWQLELMRALTTDREQRKIAQENLERATAEIEHLRAQMDDIPQIRQYAHWYGEPTFLPAGPFPFMPSGVTGEIERSRSDLKQWDFERLMSKWKGTILRSSAQPNQQESRGSPPPQQQPPPGHAGPSSNTPLSRSGFFAEMRNQMDRNGVQSGSNDKDEDEEMATPSDNDTPGQDSGSNRPEP